MEVFIDATYFAIHSSLPEDSLLHFLDRLLQLQEMAAASTVDLVTSAATYEALARADVYPLIERVPAPLFAQRHDVIRIVQGLLDRLPKFEESLGIHDILIDDSVCTCLPDAHLVGLHPALVAHHHRIMALLALASLIAVDKIVPAILLAEGIVPEPTKLATEGAVIQVEPDNGLCSGCVFPWSYTLELTACHSVGMALSNVDPTHIWLSGHRFESALTLAVHQRLVQRGAPVWPVNRAPFRMLDSFIQTAMSHGFGNSQARVEALIRACVDVTIGLNPQKSHRIRVNKGGGSPDKVRASDGAHAMRRDIDYEFHIHYWNASDGPHFASVNVHNDLSIPDEH